MSVKGRSVGKCTTKQKQAFGLMTLDAHESPLTQEHSLVNCYKSQDYACDYVTQKQKTLK